MNTTLIQVTSTKPVKNVWRIVMVFKPTSDGNEKPASVANEFEFGNGTWVNRGRTNMPPKLPKASSVRCVLVLPTLKDS